MDDKLFKKVRERQKRDLISRYALLLFVIFFASIFLFAFLYDGDKESLKESISKEVQGIATKSNDILVICVSESIDQDLYDSLQQLQEDEIKYSEDPNCGLHVTKNLTNTNDYDEVWQSIYVPVSRVDSEIEDINSDDIPQGIRAQNINGYNLIWSSPDSDKLNDISNSSITSLYKDYDDVSIVIYRSDEVVGILPLNEVTPKMKILSIDEIYPYGGEFYIYDYPLSDIIWISSGFRDNTLKAEVIDVINQYKPELQFDQEKFSTFVLTGHSAVGARQYSKQDNNPANKVQKLLREADFSHVSNENSFSDECQQVDGSKILCGDTDKIKWLTQLGVDAVSLTGSGILDYGRPVFEETLELYNENEVGYFAGGNNIEEAREPLLFDLTNSKVALLGFTTVGPRRYLATNTASGNTATDLKTEGDGQVLINSLSKLNDEAELIVVEMGWGSDFGTNISLQEADYSKIAVDNGADIVFGTTSHNPKSIMFKGDSVIFYGLGDFLYFHSEDQPHQGLIIENYLYDGRYIGFRAHPILIDDSLQIKYADVDKKREILNTVFSNTF